MRYFASLLVLFLFASCNKEAISDCGCDGITYKSINQSLALYKSGQIIELEPNGYFYVPCSPAVLGGKITDGDTIFVSGKVHMNCFKGETLVAQPAYLEVVSFRKK